MSRTVVLLNSYPGFAGSQRVMLQVARGLRDDGWRPLVLAPAGEELLETAATEAGIEVQPLPLAGGMLRYGGYWLQASPARKLGFAATELAPFWNRLRRFLVQQQARALYAANERCWLLALPAARLAGVPALWHAQTGLPGRGQPLHRLAARAAGRIVCVSRSVEQDVAAVLRPRDRWKLRTIPNGIPDLPAQRTAVLDDVAAGAHRPMLLFAGIVQPQKGVHVLVDAFARSRARLQHGWRLGIAGSLAFDPAYVDCIRQRIADAGAAGDIELLGERTDVPALIQTAAAVAYPSVESADLRWRQHHWQGSWKEGFGLTLVEAMRAATPVVASRTGGPAEVVLDGSTGLLVTPGDADALAAAIDDLAADPERARRMGRAGRQRYEAEYTDGRMVQDFRSVFSEMAA